MGRHLGGHNSWPRPRSDAPLAEMGAWMYDEIQQLKREIRPGMMFVIPSAYYCESMTRQNDHSDNYPVEMYVTEIYPDIVTLCRHRPYGDITVSPSYARLLLFERQYGSGRRPLWD